MSDDTVNPYVKARGDVTNEEKYQEMVTQATGLTPETRKRQMSDVVEGFKVRMRSQLNDLRKRIYDVEIENTELKLVLHELRNQLDELRDQSQVTR
jgi:hypothetical protein